MRTLSDHMHYEWQQSVAFTVTYEELADLTERAHELGLDVTVSNTESGTVFAAGRRVCWKPRANVKHVALNWRKKITAIWDQFDDTFGREDARHIITGGIFNDTVYDDYCSTIEC